MTDNYIEKLVNDYERYTIILYKLYRSIDSAYREKEKLKDENKKNTENVDDRIMKYRNAIYIIREKRDTIEKHFSGCGVLLRFSRFDGKDSFRAVDFGNCTRKLLKLYHDLDEACNIRAIFKSKGNVPEQNLDGKIDSFEEQIYTIKEQRNETEEEMAIEGETLSISLGSYEVSYPKKKKVIIKPENE